VVVIEVTVIAAAFLLFDILTLSRAARVSKGLTGWPRETEGVAVVASMSKLVMVTCILALCIS
jgi:hypothetical protein